MKKLFSFLAATLLLASTTYAQQSQPIPVDPAVRMGKLENGMTYYIRHNAEPQGQANFYCGGRHRCRSGRGKDSQYLWHYPCTRQSC